MNELQRQSYLKAMGLTPWVARVSLPGAAPSPLLEPPEPMAPQAQALAQSVRPIADPEPLVAAAPVPAMPETVAPTQETAAPLRLPEQDQPTASVAESAPVADSQVPPVVANPDKPQGAPLVFTLEAHLADDVWVLAEQEDSQAPGMGRFEAPLLANLLAVFGGDGRRPWRFFCPLTEQPMHGEEAGQALTAFVSSLQQQSGGEKVLLCLSEPLTQALFANPRYQPLTLGSLPALVVSSLSEMLADPALHKKRSWAAMQEQGFAH